MISPQTNPLIVHFCKELSVHLESLSHVQATLTPDEFAELVTMSTQAVLEAYKSGEYDLQAYRCTTEQGYKEIAKQSIASYSQTNDKIGELTEKHAELIGSSAVHTLIDFEKITEKFSDIQTHLSDEVSRANDVIHTLMEQVKELETKTSLDPLTKTFNRSALHEHINALLNKSELTYNIFALMIDVDDFKKINDEFGHVAGDKVLIFIAKLFKKALRDGDKVYRFGGEEFIVLINRTELEGARLVAERLLSLCRQNKPLFQSRQIPISLSIGMTKIVKSDTVDSIIERSDKAMYRAKNNGKDRLEMEF